MSAGEVGDTPGRLALTSRARGRVPAAARWRFTRNRTGSFEGALGDREHARTPWAAVRWASTLRPPNHHRRMRGPPLVCAGQDLPILVTAAASDPILLAV